MSKTSKALSNPKTNLFPCYISFMISFQWKTFWNHIKVRLPVPTGHRVDSGRLSEVSGPLPWPCDKWIFHLNALMQLPRVPKLVGPRVHTEALQRNEKCVYTYMFFFFFFFHFVQMDTRGIFQWYDGSEDRCPQKDRTFRKKAQINCMFFSTVCANMKETTVVRDFCSILSN